MSWALRHKKCYPHKCNCYRKLHSLPFEPSSPRRIPKNDFMRVLQVTPLSSSSTSCKKAKVSLTIFFSFTRNRMLAAYSDFVKHDQGKCETRL